MHRIDVPTAAPTPPPKQEPGTPGYFTSGDFIAGVKATIPGADWFNTVQAELTNTVEASGQALDRDDDTQLLQAIRTLINRSRYRPGQIVISAGEPLEGTLLCDGSAISRQDYAELFAVIGTKYGEGDGNTTFNLPLCKDGTTITHTNSADIVGVHSAGAILAHAHTASASAVGDHTHYIGVNGAGAHTHAASSGAAGDHAHGAWTDSQGHHAHTGGTAWAGDHAHNAGSFRPRYSSGGDAGFHEAYGGAVGTNTAGGHAHGFSTDGAGGHSHNVGMNGSGNHTHEIGVAGVGDHSHSLDNRGAGAHEHTVIVNSTGGEDNLPAGLRMMYCIAY
ncbi:phage tail protein [Stenotrophomonas sp. B1-1]|uniref:phage tail protein n=1 Tax=Stenotrophomonas sp. B1-1 TaxID=2710648 RepID=UPI001F07E0A6|nr:phage tail protein [Stenotrophomonas sp. B1-1]